MTAPPNPDAAPNQQPQSQPRNVIIRPYPFNSDVARKLAAALDNELNVMYPDWDELIHPNFQHGFVGGDSTTNKAVDARKYDDGAKDASMVDDAGDTAAIETSPFDDLAIEEVKQVHFHVAFDVRDVNGPVDGPGDSDNSTTLSTSSASFSSSALGEPVGCIGLRLMPYFPFHRAQPFHCEQNNDTTSTSISDSTTANGTTQPSNPVSDSVPDFLAHKRYAEIKRLYICPSHRGALVTTNNQESTPERLATVLLKHAQVYARTHLHVTHLVLETGVRQHAAIRLYERSGWRRREVFGDYVGASPAEGGVSLCFEYDLSQDYGTGDSAR